MGNKALDLNPPTADLHISVNGSDWLWAAFSVFGASLLIMIVLDFMVRVFLVCMSRLHMLTTSAETPRHSSFPPNCHYHLDYR